VDALAAYIVWHRPTGSFLRAVIENDLAQACARASDDNRAALFDLVSYVVNLAPAASWGSPARYENWIHERSNTQC
jgi:hypothetical protein